MGRLVPTGTGVAAVTTPVHKQADRPWPKRPGPVYNRTARTFSGASMSLIHPAQRAAGTHGELVELLDQHVRELVRREGVDPQRDAEVVRRIADGVVREHDECSLTGAVAPVPDVEAVVGELVARVSG